MNAMTAALTDMQAEYVRQTCLGCPPIVAATLAGYSHPDNAVTNLRKNSQVQAAIASGLRAFLYSEAAPAALRLLYRFMVDEQRDPKLRVACAKTLADRAGFIPPKAKDNSALHDKSFVDMTADELREASQRIVKELGDRSTVTIDNAPASERNNDQIIDVFD